MGLYQAICPCCGRLNRNLYLEETEGFFECEACGQIANARDFITDTSSGDEIKKLKKAEIDAKVREIAKKVDLSDEKLQKAIFPAGEPFKKAV